MDPDSRLACSECQVKPEQSVPELMDAVLCYWFPCTIGSVWPDFLFWLKGLHSVLSYLKDSVWESICVSLLIQVLR